MTQKKKRILQGTTSNLKPGTYEAMLRREKARSEKIEALLLNLRLLLQNLRQTVFDTLFSLTSMQTAILKWTALMNSLQKC